MLDDSEVMKSLEFKKFEDSDDVTEIFDRENEDILVLLSSSTNFNNALSASEALSIR